MKATNRNTELAGVVLDAMRAELAGTPDDSDRGVARILQTSQASVSRARSEGLTVRGARDWCARWAEAGRGPITVGVYVDTPSGRRFVADDNKSVVTT